MGGRDGHQRLGVAQQVWRGGRRVHRPVCWAGAAADSRRLAIGCVGLPKAQATDLEDRGADLRRSRCPVGTRVAREQFIERGLVAQLGAGIQPLDGDLGPEWKGAQRRSRRGGTCWGSVVHAPCVPCSWCSPESVGTPLPAGWHPAVVVEGRWRPEGARIVCGADHGSERPKSRPRGTASIRRQNAWTSPDAEAALRTVGLRTEFGMVPWRRHPAVRRTCGHRELRASDRRQGQASAPH